MSSLSIYFVYQKGQAMLVGAILKRRQSGRIKVKSWPRDLYSRTEAMQPTRSLQVWHAADILVGIQPGGSRYTNRHLNLQSFWAKSWYWLFKIKSEDQEL